MIIKIFEESLLYKFILWIVAIYKKSSLFSIFENIKFSYGFSKSKDKFDEYVNRNVSLGSYGKFTTFMNGILEKIGLIFKDSLLFKLLVSTPSFITRVIKNSVLGKIGIKRLFLTAFALYLPLDYFLRNIVNISVISSLWDELLMVCCIFYIIMRKMLYSKKMLSKATELDMYIILFIAVGFMLMCIVSPDLAIAIDGYRAVVQYILWFFVIINLLEEPTDFWVLFGTMCVMSLLIGFHCIYQFIIAVPIPSTWVAESEGYIRTRVFSLTGSPNVMGSFTVLFAPLFAALAYSLKNINYKLLALGCTAILCFSCLFTASKGAWIGMAIAVVIFALFIDRRLIALLFVGASGFLIFVPSVTSRIAFLFTEEYIISSMAGGRMIRWSTGLALLESVNEFWGFGLGRFGGAVAMQNQVIENLSYFYMDNYYLKTLVEMGYIGLTFYLFMLLGLIITGVRAVMRTKGTAVFPVAAALFAGMMGVLGHCYFENIFEVPYMTAYFWAFAAMLLYLSHFYNKKALVNKEFLW